MHHVRDSIRHILAAVLMAGTLAGTVWTFSNGALTLSGAWERVISVGGIAAALECGAIYTAWYLGQLDQRIQSARRRDTRAELERMQRSLYRWFYAVAAISALANLIFRAQQLDNLPLAAFVSVSPIVLVILFCIKLRPLPEDYQDIGARATGRALTRMVAQAERDVLRLMRKMGRGRTLSDAQRRQLAFGVSITGLYAKVDEQHALNNALRLAAPVVEADTDVWLRAEDLMSMYGISKRSAQSYMARVPERRRLANSNAWEAPRTSVIATHGEARSARESAQSRAHDTQPNAVDAQLDVVYASRDDSTSVRARPIVRT